MAIRHMDVLGIIEAPANLSAGGRSAVGSLSVGCRSFPGRFSVLLCVCAHVLPAIHHLGACPGPGHAPCHALGLTETVGQSCFPPGLTETVSQSCLALVKYLSDNHLTEIIGRPGSFLRISIAGLRRSRLGRFLGGSLCRAW